MTFGRINEELASIPEKLDLRDQKILSILSRNSRNPVSDIEKRTGINRDTIKYKIERLIKLEIIKKFYAEINQALFGCSTCHVFMLIDEVNVNKRNELINELIKHPNTKSIIEYTDTWDIEWVLLAKDLNNLEDITNKILSKYSEIVLEKDTLVVIRFYSTLNLPYMFYQTAGYKHVESKKEKKNKSLAAIDEKDFHILKLLGNDSRLTSVEIGKLVNLSSDAVINRIKNLYASDIITKFTIMTDRGKLGYHWYTLAIQIKYFDEHTESHFKEFVKEHPYIIRCVRTLGKWDLLLYICADTPRNFHKTAKDIKREFSNIIKSSEMWFAYKEHHFSNFPDILNVDDYQKEIK